MYPDKHVALEAGKKVFGEVLCRQQPCCATILVLLHTQSIHPRCTSEAKLAGLGNVRSAGSKDDISGWALSNRRFKAFDELYLGAKHPSTSIILAVGERVRAGRETKPRLYFMLLPCS